MSDALLSAYLTVKLLPTTLAQRIARDEAGEGVISTAIAVLIMAGLGLLMWLAFERIWGNAEGRIETNIEQIGG
ncbi:MAG TPA: hypothetical protein VM324_16045 [Egibacteraceae bacterium]|jgi:hypothetical protein|nr:hypothetical protein [Egibacteraceae bacterium]